MGNVLMLMGIVIIIMGMGGGGMYLLWFKTRPKKICWTAKCYQLGSGITPPIEDKDGNIISDLRLKDMIPYIKDTLERVELDVGMTVYRLKKLDKTTNAVNADMVEVWGKGKKEINVLIQEDTATVLKKGYDSVTGSKIFTPMQRERIEQIKSEIAIKKDRLRKEKDILTAITPWIVAGICMLALVAVAYFNANAGIEMSDNSANAIKYSSDKSIEVAKTYRNIIETDLNKQKYSNLGLVEKAEIPPPSIE